LLTAVARVVEGCKEASLKEGNGEWDGVCLAVGLRRAVVPGLEVVEAEWEDICMEGGFEWVDGEVVGRGRNEFGGMCWVGFFDYFAASSLCLFSSLFAVWEFIVVLNNVLLLAI
jgi:hypothetical protein